MANGSRGTGSSEGRAAHLPLVKRSSRDCLPAIHTLGGRQPCPQILFAFETFAASSHRAQAICETWWSVAGLFWGAPHGSLTCGIGLHVALHILSTHH